MKRINGMKKRNESSIVTAILNYLQVQENLGKIAFCDRMNSGKVFVSAPYSPTNASRWGFRGRMVRLHRAGTPDIMILLKTGGVLWLEVKAETGRQELEQKQFENMVNKLPMHHYFIVRNLDDVARILGT